jgi:N-methylhydantoinase B
MANTMNTPIEAIEAEYPLRVEAYHLIPNSGGKGKYRGGLGLRRVYRLLATEGQATTMAEHTVVPPHGLFGGEPGRCFRITLNPHREARHLKGKESVALKEGDVIVVEGVGGGGYGPPEDRERELAEKDRQEGYVTVEGET